MNYEKIKAQIITKAWKDPAFKKRLLKEPRKVFKEFGVEIPEKIKMIVEEENKNSLHLIIPHHPGNMKDLSDEELGKVAAGSWISVISHC